MCQSWCCWWPLPVVPKTVKGLGFLQRGCCSHGATGLVVKGSMPLSMVALCTIIIATCMSKASSCWNMLKLWRHLMATVFHRGVSSCLCLVSIMGIDCLNVTTIWIDGVRCQVGWDRLANSVNLDLGHDLFAKGEGRMVDAINAGYVDSQRGWYTWRLQEILHSFCNKP